MVREGFPRVAPYSLLDFGMVVESGQLLWVLLFVPASFPRFWLRGSPGSVLVPFAASALSRVP